MAESLLMRRIGRTDQNDAIDAVQPEVPGKGSVGDRKNRRIRSNAERQGDDGYRSESGSLGERANSVANILPPAFEPGEGPHLAAGLLRSGALQSGHPSRPLSC